jgi:hypothetical protein
VRLDAVSKPPTSVLRALHKETRPVKSCIGLVNIKLAEDDWISSYQSECIMLCLSEGYHASVEDFRCKGSSFLSDVVFNKLRMSYNCQSEEENCMYSKPSLIRSNGGLRSSGLSDDPD